MLRDPAGTVALARPMPTDHSPITDLAPMASAPVDPPTPRRGEPIAAHRQGATALASAQDPLVPVAGLTHGSVGSIPIPGGTDACVHGSAGPGSPGRARAAGQVPGDSREARDVPAKRRGQPPIGPRNFRVITR